MEGAPNQRPEDWQLENREDLEEELVAKRKSLDILQREMRELEERLIETIKAKGRSPNQEVDKKAEMSFRALEISGQRAKKRGETIEIEKRIGVLQKWLGQATLDLNNKHNG